MATHLDYIFIDENNAHLISQTVTRFGNSDHLLVECTLGLKSKNKASALWRFDTSCFKNKMLEKEILEEISVTKNSEDWDFCKIRIQSIIRAFRKPRATENKISSLNKKITSLNKRLALNPDNAYLYSQVERLKMEFQEELVLFANK